MKRPSLAQLLVVAFCMIFVALLYSLPTYADWKGAIVDNFDATSINTFLWAPFHDSPQQRVTQQTGELRVKIDAASAGDEFGAGLKSRFRLKGDFDMMVDYRLITWPATNGVRLGFEGPGFGPDSYTEFMVKRRSHGVEEPPTDKEVYGADFKEGEEWNGGMVPTADDHGSLRLTRSGSVLTGYFSKDGGPWQFIGSHNFSTSPGLPEWIAVTLWANSKTEGQFPNGTVKIFAGQDVEIAYDNFRVFYDQIKFISDISPVSLLLLE
jgi:hypothetical protein